METFDGWGQVREAGLVDVRLPQRRNGNAREWMADEWLPEDADCWFCERTLPAGQRHLAFRVGDSIRRACLGRCLARPYPKPRKASRWRVMRRVLELVCGALATVAFAWLVVVLGIILAGG